MRINLSTPLSDDKERQRRNEVIIAAIERHTEERMNDEYGRIHTDGSRSGGQPVVDNAMLEALQKDAGIPHLPTQETYQFRMAVSGEGPLAHQWSDKPHRLLYDACSIIESAAAQRQPTQIDALQADIEAMESILWVDTIIDDQEAITKAFARHRQHGYDQGYYDGCARQPTQSDALAKCLAALDDEEVVHAIDCNKVEQRATWGSALKMCRQRITAALQEQSK